MGNVKKNDNRQSSHFICIDFQYDFCEPEGRWFKERASHAFIKETFTDFLLAENLKVAEIISDYRLPRPSETQAYCVPGEKGYLSSLKKEIALEQPWIKSMNSPLWTRNHAGNPNKKAGEPYIDDAGFKHWLEKQVGSPSKVEMIYLMGLTLDCCVLATAQALYYLGYGNKVNVLFEGVDTYSGSIQEKESLLKASMYQLMWANGYITWDRLKENLIQ